MAKVYAQHATCGKYHLETRFAVDHWEWFAAPIKTTERLPQFSGNSDTLHTAKTSAMQSIGLAFAPWMNIGPPVEVAD
jgi:hypothetical protein